MTTSSRRSLVVAAALVFAPLALAPADDDGWIDLTADGLAAFRGPTGAWAVVADAGLDPDDPKHLRGQPGTGAIVNDPPGRTANLVTKQAFGDAEVHLEFLVPKGSNSGIKLQGLYEIQIFDSHGIDPPTASHSGGIYPRAELLPRYRHIDDGIPPRLNASKPAGEWQTLDLVFRAPRFDSDGQKTANARFDKVALNGQVVHENVELLYPTGHAWNTKKEIPAGPIMLQADHGPVAFRKVRVRVLGN